MSRHHVRLSTRRWERVKRAALKRSGFRSEKSGAAGRLEVHHIRALDAGGDPYDLANVQVLTRAEHIAEHAAEVPGRSDWRRYLMEMAR